jgi:hypothetical protein
MHLRSLHKTTDSTKRYGKEKGEQELRAEQNTGLSWNFRGWCLDFRPGGRLLESMMRFLTSWITAGMKLLTMRLGTEFKSVKMRLPHLLNHQPWMTCSGLTAFQDAQAGWVAVSHWAIGVGCFSFNRDILPAEASRGGAPSRSEAKYRAAVETTRHCQRINPGAGSPVSAHGSRTFWTTISEVAGKLPFDFSRTKRHFESDVV